MDYPVEILSMTYSQISENEFVVVFIVNGEMLDPVFVPKCDPHSLASCINKMIRVLSDPVGECINDIPY